MKTEKAEDIKKTVKETEKLFKHFNFGNLYGSSSKKDKAIRKTEIQVHILIDQYLNGLRTENEFRTKLDKVGVRGAIGQKRFTGYDYNNQKWIEIVI